MSKVHHWLAVTGCAVTLAGGCSNQKPAPLYASSADQGGYATRYPVELGAARGNIGEQESRARRLMAEFETYPNALNKPNWSQVQRVVELADQAGRSEEYARSRGAFSGSPRTTRAKSRRSSAELRRTRSTPPSSERSETAYAPTTRRNAISSSTRSRSARKMRSFSPSKRTRSPKRATRYTSASNAIGDRWNGWSPSRRTFVRRWRTKSRT
jgi:hypothetical protein